MQICVTLETSIKGRLRDFPLAQLVKNPPAMQEILIQFLHWEDRWRRDRLLTPVFLGFPCSSAGKESSCNAGDLGSVPGLGRSSGEGKGYPLQYSGLENSMDCIVHGVAKSWTRLSDFYRSPLTQGTSLVVQWLRLHAPNTGDPGSIPGQGTRPHMLQLRVCKPQLKILHAE